jgi:hypothetical protein
MDARERELVDINTRDILNAIAIPVAWLQRAVGLSVRCPARIFARELRAFDDDAAAFGLRRAARAMLSVFHQTLSVNGADRLPGRGPLILLSNHPGLTDTLALFAAIPRDDLMTLAADRPFLRSLPAVARSLLFLSDPGRSRLAAVRQAVAHLRSGGTLLTFPAGAIEPDPTVMPGAGESLSHWSSSTMLFLRRVPDAVVVPVVVQGVIARAALRHPLTLLRKDSKDRERLAAMLQIVTHAISPDRWTVHPRVDFLQPFVGAELTKAAEGAPRMIRERIEGFLSSRERAAPGGFVQGLPR